MSASTIEERLIKLEYSLSNLKIWLWPYEDDVNTRLTEIEKRLIYLERFNTDGR